MQLFQDSAFNLAHGCLLCRRGPIASRLGRVFVDVVDAPIREAASLSTRIPPLGRTLGHETTAARRFPIAVLALVETDPLLRLGRHVLDQEHGVVHFRHTFTVNQIGLDARSPRHIGLAHDGKRDDRDGSIGGLTDRLPREPDWLVPIDHDVLLLQQGQGVAELRVQQCVLDLVPDEPVVVAAQHADALDHPVLDIDEAVAASGHEAVPVVGTLALDHDERGHTELEGSSDLFQLRQPALIHDRLEGQMTFEVELRGVHQGILFSASRSASILLA